MAAVVYTVPWMAAGSFGKPNGAVMEADESFSDSLRMESAIEMAILVQCERFTMGNSSRNVVKVES